MLVNKLINNVRLYIAKIGHKVTSFYSNTQHFKLKSISPTKNIMYLREQLTT